MNTDLGGNKPQNDTDELKYFDRVESSAEKHGKKMLFLSIPLSILVRSGPFHCPFGSVPVSIPVRSGPFRYLHALVLFLYELNVLFKQECPLIVFWGMRR